MVKRHTKHGTIPTLQLAYACVVLLIMTGTLFGVIISTLAPISIAFSVFLCVIPWLGIMTFPDLATNAELTRLGFIVLAWFIWILQSFVMLMAQRGARTHATEAHDVLDALKLGVGPHRSSVLADGVRVTISICAGLLSLLASLAYCRPSLARWTRTGVSLYTVFALVLTPSFSMTFISPIARVTMFVAVASVMAAYRGTTKQLALYFLEIYYALLVDLWLIPFVLALQYVVVRRDGIAETPPVFDATPSKLGYIAARLAANETIHLAYDASNMASSIVGTPPHQPLPQPPCFVVVAHQPTESPILSPERQSEGSASPTTAHRGADKNALAQRRALISASLST